jgi:hypothetical protein
MIAFAKSKEQAALSLVQRAMENQAITSDDTDLNVMMMQSRRTSQVPDSISNRIGGANRFSSLSDSQETDAPAVGSAKDSTNGIMGFDNKQIGIAILASLPTVINQQFKDDLKTLSEYSKLNDEPNPDRAANEPKTTPEQDKAALEAYNRVGKQLKLAIVTPVIALALQAKLSEYLGTGLATTAANIAAKPLAEMAVAAQGAQEFLIKEVINRGLKMVGIKDVSTDRLDLFMASTIGKFTGNILEEIEKREKDGTLRGDVVKAQKEVAAAGMDR